MALRKARRTSPPNGPPDRVSYRQQYVRCGKAGCTKCPPHGPGHGPYWYGFYWSSRQRTRSVYVGKVLPAGVEPLGEAEDAAGAASDAPEPSTAELPPEPGRGPGPA